jgi:hypothetical protein
MMNNRDRGAFLPALGLVLLVVLLVAGGYYLNGLNKDQVSVSKSTTALPSTVASTEPISPTIQYFTIPELGIKFPTAKISDFSYTIRSDDPTVADFSTKTLTTKGGVYCASEHGPIGLITIHSEPLVQSPDGPAVDPYIAKVGNKYIYYYHPQATCSDNKAVQDLAGQATDELQQQLKSAELAP